MKRKVPRMTTDREAEAFLAKDLSDLEFSQFTPVMFEFEAKSGQLNMRLPQALLDAIKQRAAARGIPYTKFVRQVLEAGLSPDTEVLPSRAGRRALVGARSRSNKVLDSLVQGAEKLPAHLQDAVLAMIEILGASPAGVRDQFGPALERIVTAIVHGQTEIGQLSQEMVGIKNKLHDMAGQLTATVADQGNQIKQLQDRYRVLHESLNRDVATKTLAL
jgi:predicted DNA binding CopG/RHH family protein